MPNKNGVFKIRAWDLKKPSTSVQLGEQVKPGFQAGSLLRSFRILVEFF